MTDVRAERCGKPVGLAGHPCMRVPGHPGVCLSGVEMPPNLPDFPFMDLTPHRFISWKVIAIAAAFWVLFCAQIAVDVYALMR